MMRSVLIATAASGLAAGCAQVREAPPQPPENSLCLLMRAEFIDLAKAAALDEALASTVPEQGAENNHLVRVTNALVRRQTLFDQMGQMQCRPAPYIPMDAFAREALACKIAMRTTSPQGDAPLEACRLSTWQMPNS